MTDVTLARKGNSLLISVSLPAVAKKSTLPEPFSFEQRDQSTMAKKEEKIQKFLDEEKAAREFHAKPILRAVCTKFISIVVQFL